MTVCPIAIVASCEKCPAFGLCPLKSVLGDYKPPPPTLTGEKQKVSAPKTEQKGKRSK